MQNSRTVVIVGGVAGGMSAATRLRRLDEHARIVVFERGEHVSFANCGLPYVVGGVIEERDDVLLQTPEQLRERFDLEVLVRHEVVAVHTETREVAVRDLATGEAWHQRYDDLVLSPGAIPVRPPIPGIARALTMRDVGDLDQMMDAVQTARTAVIIGGGFIGLEMAENLHHRGIAVTVVEAADQVMGPLDRELLIDPGSDEILGAQAVGGSGVDKRIDVIATAMAGGLLASDLADLELAYAPQFGSAKDPVNMLGFIAENLRDGLVSTIQWHQLGDAVASGATLVDVRTDAERAAGSIPGSVHLPLDELRKRLDELPSGDLVVHCAVGQRGHVAARLLTQRGCSVRNLDGGMRTWSAAVDNLLTALV